MIEILECGPLNSIQDLGRFGLRGIGIGTSGAMDAMALRAGNALVGNRDELAGIELQTFPFAIRFAHDTRFAITGADAAALLDVLALPPWWSTVARVGQVLRVTQPRSGARAYLSIAGGADVPLTLGSRSTNMRNGFGGLGGRALQKGDRLATGIGAASDLEFGADVPANLVGHGAELTIRIVTGAEFAILPPALQRLFLETSWTITPQSDRGGYRLRGPELKLPMHMEMRSYGVVAGIIQLPPSGQPIVQLSDANTAGGYPRLGGVIEADLHRMGQARPGTRIRFVDVDFAAAQDAWQNVEGFLAGLRDAITTLSTPIHPEGLRT